MNDVVSGCLGWMRAREWPRQLLIATLVVAFMVLGTFLGQQLQQTFGYQQPLFLTWFGTSFLAVLLLGQFLGFAIPLCATGGGHCVSPLLAAHMFLTRIHNLMTTTTTATIVQKERDQEIDEEHPFPGEGAEDHESYLLRYQTHSNSAFEERPSTVEERKSAWLLCSRAVLFSVFWMMANYLFSMAQAFTNSSSLLTLEQAATVFVFILSVWLINEQVTFPKVLAVGICIGGVIIFAFAATSSSSSSTNNEETGIAWRELIGDLLVLASTLCTALYMVLFKKLMHFPLSILVLNCFLGLIGLSVFFFYWPLLLIADQVGWEIFRLPSGASVLAMFFANAVVSLLFNYVLNLGVIVVSPLFMRIAVLFTIPVSFLIDFLALQVAVDLVQIAGACFIVLGFTGFLYAHHLATQEAVNSVLTISESSASESISKQTEVEAKKEEEEEIESMNSAFNHSIIDDF